MVGWHHWLKPNGHVFGWTPGVDDGQGGLACCSPWGRKESDMTEQINWTELNDLLKAELECVHLLTSQGHIYMHVYLHMCILIVVVVLVAQSCPILRDPMDYSPPGSSVHGILQARMLERVAIPFSNSLLHFRQILYLLSYQRSPFGGLQLTSVCFVFVSSRISPQPSHW